MTFNDEDNSSSGTCLEIDKANVLPDNGALVTSDARHPSGWNISVRGLAVPLVPKVDNWRHSSRNAAPSSLTSSSPTQATG
jgi:hypothetical protein